jgi:hypothetical protein
VKKGAHEKRLYHYTTSAGLIGILESRRIYASEIRFLNDMREFSEALDLIQRLNSDILKGRRSKAATFVNGRIQSLLRLPKSIVTGIFVTSFSEEGNQLGQWRGYCPQGGFSIGFEADYLKQQLNLQPCLYTQRKQMAFLRREVMPSLRKTYAAFPRRNYEELSQDDFFGIMKEHEITFAALVDKLKEAAPVIKNGKFSQEKEWRLIVQRPIESDAIDFRPGKYQPTPYTQIDLDTSKIVQIVIGPTPEPEIALNSVRSLLKHYNLPCDEIVIDMVPIRSW